MVTNGITHANSNQDIVGFKMINQGLSIELYQYFLNLSSGKIPALPSITRIGQEINISRQAIYQWANGQIACPKIVRYLKEVTDITFPVKLSEQEISRVRNILHIR